MTITSLTLNKINQFKSNSTNNTAKNPLLNTKSDVLELNTAKNLSFEKKDAPVVIKIDLGIDEIFEKLTSDEITRLKMFYADQALEEKEAELLVSNTIRQETKNLDKDDQKKVIDYIQNPKSEVHPEDIKVDKKNKTLYINRLEKARQNYNNVQNTLTSVSDMKDIIYEFIFPIISVILSNLNSWKDK